MFGSLISPKIGLGIVRKQLEAELNAHFKVRLGTNYVFKPVNAFTLAINNASKTITFIVNGISYAYNDGDTLSKLINHLIEQKLGNDKTIDLVLINYTSEGVRINIGYTENGNKLQKELTL